MEDIVELSERLWRGEFDAHQNATMLVGRLTPVTERVRFRPAFGNATAIDTGDGLVLVDTGSQISAQEIFDDVRSWTKAPLHSAIYSHGHIDHVFGVDVFEEESREHGWAGPRVIAHENVGRRFDRYSMTRGYNQTINRRQFGISNLEWPERYRYADEEYREQMSLRVGAVDFELTHEMGETDDATVTWIPEEKVLCSGDLFVWSSPNAGNPQKVQRYPREWAQALRRMAALGATALLPGHGLPVFGAERIHQALVDTADYLDAIVNQVLEMMNAGARLSDVVAHVTAPAHLAERPYLRPTYDEPEFIVHNIWRLYGGWWDGNPAHLHPAPERDLAREFAELAGGPTRLAERAETLFHQGDEASVRLAGHLCETAWLAAPDDPETQRVRQLVFSGRAERATSTMARGVYRWAERETRGEAY